MPTQHKSDSTHRFVLSRIAELQRNRAVRDSTHQFWIEGIRQFVHAADARFHFDTIVTSRPLLKSGLTRKLAQRLVKSGYRHLDLPPEQFRSIAQLERASGIGAIVRQKWISINELDMREARGWIVIESIRSGGNLGTILRTTAATGMGGVIFTSNRCDIFDPSVVRASMGGIFDLPIVRTSMHDLARWAKLNDISILGLDSNASRLWPDCPTGKLAIVLGDERAGISNPMRSICQHLIRLPMTGKTDSINVSVAAGVMMYEMLRAP